MKARPRIDSSGAQWVLDVNNYDNVYAKHYITSQIVLNTSTVNFIVDLTAVTSTTKVVMALGMSGDTDALTTLSRSPLWTTTGSSLLSAVNRDETNSTTANTKVYYKPTINTSGTTLILSDYMPGTAASGRFCLGKINGCDNIRLKPGSIYQLNNVVKTLTLGSVTAVFIFDWYEIDIAK